MTHTSLYFLMGVGLCSISACTTTAPVKTNESVTGVAFYKKDIRLGEQVQNICFAEQITKFRLFGADTVIVKSGLGDEFILDVDQNCTTLDTATSVKLVQGNSCLGTQDTLVISDVYDTSEHCTINQMNRWNEEIDPVELQGIRPEDIQPIMEPLE